MYPRSFHYHRAGSLEEAVSMLSSLGPEARLLAGGQSLIPLMKLRLAAPQHLVDMNFAPGLSYIDSAGSQLRIGAMTRHAELEASADARRIPILHDCAAGIADVQVRNRGTLGGSLAEADPTGDWAPVLLALGAEVVCLGPQGQRVLSLDSFIQDAFTTALAPAELVREIIVKTPSAKSGGAYFAFKACAPVYAAASAAAQLTLQEGVCSAAGIFLSAVALTPIHAAEAEGALMGKPVSEKSIAAAAEAAAAACDPPADLRGSKDFKRALIRALVTRAVDAAHRRARGESVEVSHLYA
jgi:carbon-monoxide dehydrogenase medium subunit